MLLHTNHLLLFVFCFLTLVVLLAMLFSIPVRIPPSKSKPKGYCPICGHSLYSGEKVHSKQIEIGNTELQNRIRGCVYCVAPDNKRDRSCPICKEPLAQDKSILAISDPRVDRLKLRVKGCDKCFPQGFH